MASKFIIIAAILAFANAVVGVNAGESTYSAAPERTAYSAPVPAARFTAPIFQDRSTQGPVVASYSAASPALVPTYNNYPTPVASSPPVFTRGFSPVAYSTLAVASAPVYTYGTVAPVAYSAPAQAAYSAPLVAAYPSASVISSYSAPPGYSNAVNPC